MTVSWHQANEADLPEEYEGRHTSEVQERNCGEAEPRKQMKWLIHEVRPLSLSSYIARS